MGLDEEVLVIPASRLEAIGGFSGFIGVREGFLDQLLDQQYMDFIARRDCEEDPNFKQLIPYVVLTHTDSSGKLSVFQYTRGSGQGESRLHAKRSVGVGGHLSREDADGDDLYRTGMHREIEEELVLDSPYKEHIVGFIYDDTSPVGRVHLGVVHRFDLESPNARAREEDLSDAGFAPLAELMQNIDQFETWSQLCLNHIFNPA